jgi:hypothetical protein
MSIKRQNEFGPCPTYADCDSCVLCHSKGIDWKMKKYVADKATNVAGGECNQQMNAQKKRKHIELQSNCKSYLHFRLRFLADICVLCHIKGIDWKMKEYVAEQQGNK